MNATDVCQWLSAAEQVQEPTLKNLWSAAKGKSTPGGSLPQLRAVQQAIIRLENLDNFLQGSGPYKGENSLGQIEAAKGFFAQATLNPAVVQRLASIEVRVQAHSTEHSSFGSDEALVMQESADLRAQLQALLSTEELQIEESADKPVPFRLADIRDPSALLDAANAELGDAGFRQNLRGLQLRLANRLEDKRSYSFVNFEKIGIDSLSDWLDALGQGAETGPKVSVIDCSMLSDDILPYACGVIGRTLLELREHADAARRFHEPWVVVLEEAHNYVRPARQDEPRGVKVSRAAFERIAKEGRKFGISMIVASQRPSEISGTVLSQCANFIMHRPRRIPSSPT